MVVSRLRSRIRTDLQIQIALTAYVDSSNFPVVTGAEWWYIPAVRLTYLKRFLDQL